jgi:hypothetical protein
MRRFLCPAPPRTSRTSCDLLRTAGEGGSLSFDITNIVHMNILITIQQVYIDDGGFALYQGHSYCRTQALPHPKLETLPKACPAEILRRRPGRQYLGPEAVGRRRTLRSWSRCSLVSKNTIIGSKCVHPWQSLSHICTACCEETVWPCLDAHVVRRLEHVKIEDIIQKGMDEQSTVGMPQDRQQLEAPFRGHFSHRHSKLSFDNVQLLLHISCFLLKTA